MIRTQEIVEVVTAVIVAVAVAVAQVEEDLHVMPKMKKYQTQ